MCGWGVVGGSTKTTEMPVVFLLGFLVEVFSFSSTVKDGAVQKSQNENEKVFVFVFVRR